MLHSTSECGALISLEHMIVFSVKTGIFYRISSHLISSLTILVGPKHHTPRAGPLGNEVRPVSFCLETLGREDLRINSPDL
jgi:hypothetical protein